MAGPGSVLSFEVAGGFDAARAVLEGVRLIVSAVSLGSTDTLLQHPAGLTHRCVSDAAKASSGISPSLLRLSVGLEDPEDLWRDLELTLEAAHRQAAATLSVVAETAASR
jgi:methionine-gamma-lyase